jgi:dihydrofolate synthase/folylpolyglutamate synthase
LTPRAAEAYLRERTQLGIKFGLSTMSSLVSALGHPEQTFRCVLVAGTNGKGSVCAYLESALRAAGLEAGLYTSPHLVRVNERIAVSGRAISDRDLARALTAVRDCAEALRRAGTIAAHPTYFEVVTAAAFVHFRRAAVDVAVLEVGLGGRLDATNVSDPLVSAVVSLDFDHEAFLGTTLDAIAREKAGVMRPGRAVVIGPVPDEARRALLDEAGKKNARVVEALLRVAVLEDSAGRLPGCGSTARGPGEAFPACAGRGACSRCPAGRHCCWTAPTTRRGRGRSASTSPRAGLSSCSSA